MKIERRWMIAKELRVARPDGEPPKIIGHAAVFNSLSLDLGGFREQIAPGAFAQSIAEDDILALWNHDPSAVLGRNTAKTLRLVEDEAGLAVEILPPDTQDGRDVLTLIDRGDVKGMSFGFRTRKDAWTKQTTGYVRTLLDVQLLDVSPVTYPAYPQTDLAVRAAELGLWLPTPPPDLPNFDLMRRRLLLAELD